MDLTPTSDQIAILDALGSLTRPFMSPPLHDTSFALVDAQLDRELEEGGFLDVAFSPELGPVTAAMVVERLARLPYASEAAISGLVRPLFNVPLPRPVCIVEIGRWQAPVRFLQAGATVIVIGDGAVRSFVARESDIRHERGSLSGYPMAALAAGPEAADTVHRQVMEEDVRLRWRIALAAEAAGLTAAALASTVQYTTERKQFGRPIAAFQALQHRLAEAQVRANSLYWMALRAAETLDHGDAALAALHAQETARVVTYDFHQMFGAMGMTLEHPLHSWTYRLKSLLAELGGRSVQGLAAAKALWPTRIETGN